MKRFAVGVLAVILSTSATYAAESANTARVPVPVVQINKDRGEQCVEPTEEMRRNHMEKILHQRDRTMHDGVRTTKHSLKNCIDCHADPKTNSVLGKDGFCESCHRYVSVSIDCFSCHSAERETQAVATDAGPRALRAAAKGKKP